MEKGFKQLKGMRIMVSIPQKEKSVIALTPEVQAEMDKEYWLKAEKLKVYAIGENVEGISIGDEVYIPTDEIRRGCFIEINGEVKLIVNYMAVSLIW